MRALYSLLIRFYLAGVWLASFFSPKARQWVDGRKGLFKKMAEAAPRSGKIAWFHCASLGEFEQGRPVIEKFRKDFPEYHILLTFFSPSGYEIRKNYPGADHIFYLPPDTPNNVKRFLELWDPQLAVFVKYEFWFNFIHGLHKRNIPVVLVSAIFRPGQHFFRFYGGWFRKQLGKFSAVFVQDQASLDLLGKAGINNARISGDTRFDRVFEVSRAPMNFPEVEKFAFGKTVMVCGSTWSADEQLLLPLMNNEQLDMKFIIAPHEIREESIKKLQENLRVKSARYSLVKGPVPEETRVLIINRIGMLSQLYQYGQMAYIGGGFGRGIHNILEAATFGLPVFFGPHYQKFSEARELISRQGAFSVRESRHLEEKVKSFLADQAVFSKAAETCRNYVKEKKGATRIIMDGLSNLMIETSVSGNQ